MAKSRRNRAKAAQRSDPISRQTKPPTDPELARIREQKILPVLKDLKGTELKARSLAASAIANIIPDEKCRKLLLREQIVTILLNETLTDSSPDAKASGWEILRLLVEYEDAGFCIHLYRLDVLSAIEFACGSVQETLQSTEPPFDKMTKAQRELVWRISVALCSLIGALAEAQDDILEAIVTRAKIVSFLTALVSRETTQPDVLDECLTCLLVLTEDNRRLAEEIVASPAFEMIMSLREVDGASSVLACGVLHNVFSAMDWNDNNPGKFSAMDECLIHRLSRTLQDYRKPGSENTDQGWNAPPALAKMALETLASIGTRIQDTLSGEDTGEPGAQNGQTEEDHEMGDDADADVEVDELEIDVGKGDEDDEDDMEDLEEDMERVARDSDSSGAQGLDLVPTLGAFLKKAMPQITRIAKLPAQSDEETENNKHALSALNNIAWSLASLDFSDGQNSGIGKVWLPLALQLWEEVVRPVLAANTTDLDLATIVTGLSWALSRSLGGGRIEPRIEEAQKFIALYKATKDLPPGDGTGKSASAETEDPFQSLGVKCIGVLGQLALDPSPLDLNREIGIFLTTVVSSLPDAPLAHVVEALNQLFDIYGDEDAPCDEVFWKNGLLNHLEASLPKLRSARRSIQKQSSQLQELRERTDDAVTNLDRFIKYKKENRPSH